MNENENKINGKLIKKFLDKYESNNDSMLSEFLPYVQVYGKPDTQ